MKILLYYHSGSKNHGCEAIVRGIYKLFQNDDIILYTFDEQSDRKYGLGELVTIKSCNDRKTKYTFWDKVLIKLRVLRVTENCFRDMLKEDVDWAFAIGGDSYCYPGQPAELAYINKELKKRNVKTALIGCSIDYEVLRNKKVIKDLQNYDYIISREQLTYEELKKYDINNVFLFPDPAFILNKRIDKVKLDEKKEWVGINISPLIIKKESKQNVVYKNYVYLIEYILNRTEYNIAFIPHVTVGWDDDLSVLKMLYGEFKETGRVQLIEEDNCEVLKGVVSQCKIVLCSRTHVSIAAYSEKIPTLVVGYSIKSKGIATDIFGEYEHYIIPVEKLEQENELVSAFCWLQSQEKNIVSVFEKVIPQFKSKILKLSSIFKEE